jgi:hypothetical protein
MARMMIAHIDKKRKALGIDKARERVLMDMADFLFLRRSALKARSRSERLSSRDSNITSH